MATASPWPLIHAERRALAEDLASLDDAQWSAPSLCGDWTVRDVLGHMTATARMTPARFLMEMAGSGFRFNAMNAKNVRRETAGTPAQGLAEFRSLESRTTSPPGPTVAMLGEAIIHGEDIRRPVGIYRDYPTEAVIQVADFFKGSNLLIGSKDRIAGLTLRATDTQWSAGSGPEVSGPVLSLALAMTGRAAALADLSGDGLATLQARYQAAG
jgi:uncharacterized protein (TIGR03083 family)